MTSTRTLAVALSDHPFLSSIPLESWGRLAAHAQGQTFAAGHELFREGAAADRFYLIRHGLIRLDVEVPGRGRVEVEEMGADAALGWSWLFSPYEWHLSATAIERTSALVFDADVLRAVMASDPVLGYELMRRFAAVMFDRLQATRLRLSEVGADMPLAGAGGPWAGRRTNAPSWR